LSVSYDWLDILTHLYFIYFYVEWLGIFTSILFHFEGIICPILAHYNKIE